MGVPYSSLECWAFRTVDAKPRRLGASQKSAKDRSASRVRRMRSTSRMAATESPPTVKKSSSGIAARPRLSSHSAASVASKSD